MSNAKRCDRCGIYFERCGNHTLTRRRLDTINFGPINDVIDLCCDCETEFEEFMRGAEPKNLLERIRQMMCKE